MSTANASTPADTQLAWFVGAPEPISTADLTQHVDAAAINAAGGAAALSITLAQLAPITVTQTLTDTATEVQVLAHIAPGPAELTLTVDGAGLISGLTVAPYAPKPTTWAGVDSELRSVAPQVSYATSVLEPNGRCRLVHGLAPNTQRPLGSAFKLYVLGALGKAVTDGKASWDEQLAINDAWKSLPSGILQNEPAGTELPLSTYADEMISISDNTAADHLIHFLGRNAVQDQLFRFGNSRPQSDIPFPTTRELFAFKSVQYPTLANRYLSLPRPLRASALDAADQIPLSGLSVWTTPEKINQLEWFASATDMCHAYAGLWRENQPQINTALSINDGGLGLDRTADPTVWFKGGSEPGVLTLNYLIRSASGRITVTSVLWGNQNANIDEWTAIGVGFAAVRAALTIG
ncbi:MAG TPA: serine hydrolase [Pseudonocardiaceae bacterium]|nr:serine hydrolase [Pseudonocardiaceae bacterium]